MRTFDYMNLPGELFERKVGDLNALLHQDKGRMDVLKQLYPNELAQLARRAHQDNVSASLHIEGLYLPDIRLRQVIAEQQRLWPNLSAQFVGGLDDIESQVAGYSHALSCIERDADELELSSATVVRFFEDVFCGQKFGMRSRYLQKYFVYMQVEG